MYIKTYYTYTTFYIISAIVQFEMLIYLFILSKVAVKFS